jgi:AcrR family transcriptional regulator
MPARRRTYDSPLRAEQVDRTRDKLIQAGVDLLIEGGSEELTVRRVAARARVSVPTAYRYFPDRETLTTELGTWIGSHISSEPLPHDVDDMLAWIREIYAAFESNDRLMRAQLNTPTGRAIRELQRSTRNVQALEFAKHAFPDAPEVMQRRVAALCRALIRVPTWVVLNDDWNMGGVESGELVAWAVNALLEAARRDSSLLERTDLGSRRAATEPSPPGRRSRRKRAG